MASNRGENDQPAEVAGVAGDSLFNGPPEKPPHMLYVLFAQGGGVHRASRVLHPLPRRRACADDGRAPGGKTVEPNLPLTRLAGLKATAPRMSPRFLHRKGPFGVILVTTPGSRSFPDLGYPQAVALLLV